MCTLCFDCKKSITNGCPWARSFEPVPGWKIRKKQNHGETLTVVLQCPLFEDDSQRELRLKFNKQYGMSYSAFYYLLRRKKIDLELKKLIYCRLTRNYFWNENRIKRKLSNGKVNL